MTEPNVPRRDGAVFGKVVQALLTGVITSLAEYSREMLPKTNGDASGRHRINREYRSDLNQSGETGARAE